MNHIIPTDKYKLISDLYYRKDVTGEFEVMFSHDDHFFTYEKYLDVLYYASSMQKNKDYQLIFSKNLDVILKVENRIFRISIEDKPDVKIMDIVREMYYKQNFIIFKNLLERDDVKFIMKDKTLHHHVDLTETPYPIRFRLSIEKEVVDRDKIIQFVSENSHQLNNNIIFRYKERASLIHKKSGVSIDITSIKMSNSLQTINQYPSYELEIEALSQKPTDTQFDSLMDHLETIFKVMEKTNILISRTESQNVITSYEQLMGIKSESHSLKARQVVSLELYHVINQLPGNYALTEKADGDRMFLYVTQNGAGYLINTQLHVKKIVLPKIGKEYYQTIIDGEYLQLKDGKYLFLAFDILFYQGQDVRNIKNLRERIKLLDDVVGIIGNAFTSKDYYSTVKNATFDLKKIATHVSGQAKEYAEHLKKIIKGDFPICRKFFVFPYGGSLNEIFAYSSAVWNVLVQHAPYQLDGLIYVPLSGGYDLIYHHGEKQNFLEYKWKPAEKNSIDFYITFEKDSTGKTAVLYDKGKTNRPYVIANLKVGLKKNKIEEAVIFAPKGDAQKAYLYLDNANSQPKDAEGKIIQDNSVVEFVYDLKTGWYPLKTRADKTYMANKFKKRMGNSVQVAGNIWRTIHENFIMADIEALGHSDEDQYQILMDSLGKRMKTATFDKQGPPVQSTGPERPYYEKRTDLAKPMRAFHNWIKTCLIKTYCSPWIKKDMMTSKRILDIGCGRGGDLPKMVHAKPKLYVGIDSDYAGLFTIDGSAQQRLKNIVKNPREQLNYHFYHADGGKFLGDQIKIDDKFDLISIQFALHYFLNTPESFDGLCQNINTYLENRGYLIATCFDGDLIHEAFGKKDRYTVNVKNSRGEEQPFIDIKKLYVEQSLTGNVIDFYNSTISTENVYIKEALVYPSKLIQAFKEKCGLELIETELFENIFKLNKEYFLNSNDEQVKRYYQLLEETTSNTVLDPDEKNMAEASFEFTKLNRLYVFQKRVKQEQAQERMLFTDLPKEKKMIPLKFAGIPDNFYAFTTAYDDLESLKDDVLLKNKLKHAGVVMIHNKSDRMFLDGKPIENDSIHMSKDSNKEDSYIIVYRVKDHYYPVIYSSDEKKKKIIFSKENKFVSLINVK